MNPSWIQSEFIWLISGLYVNASISFFFIHCWSLLYILCNIYSPESSMAPKAMLCSACSGSQENSGWLSNHKIFFSHFCANNAARRSKRWARTPVGSREFTLSGAGAWGGRVGNICRCQWQQRPDARLCSLVYLWSSVSKILPLEEQLYSLFLVSRNKTSVRVAGCLSL